MRQLAGYALLIAALFWRVWWRDEMSGWDCAVEYWPDLVFQVHSIGDAHWPSWNPYAMGGYPYWADPQTGLYHPASWLCWAASAIGGDGAWLVQLKVFVNLLAGLCGMHAWTWARTRSHPAAVVAAVTFVIGSPLLVHKSGSLLWPVLYWPWALLALERAVARPTWRRGAVLAGALWLVGTAGHPQSFFYGAIVLGLYGAFLVIAAAPRRPHRALARQWRVALAAGGIGAALLAATWVPARAAVDASPRAERDDLYVLDEALWPSELDELVAPELDDNWQRDVYVGPLALVGGLWLLGVATGRARAQAAFWCGIAALGLVLALGEDGHLLPWLSHHVPGFDLFRVAYRHKLIFGLAAAVLAGDATAAMLRGRPPAWAPWLWIGLLVEWLVLLVMVQPTSTEGWLYGLATLLVAGLAIAGADTPGAWPRRFRTAAAIALPALVICDLWSAGATKLWILQPRPTRGEIVASVPALEGTDGAWRYHVGDAAPPYGGTVPYQAAFLAERREQSGYLNPIEPRRHAELEARAWDWPEVLRQMNVRYLAGHWWQPSDATEVAPGIVELDDVAPLARWYPRAETLEPIEVLDRLTLTRPSQTTAAYVEAPDVRGVALPDSDGAPVAGRLVRYSPDEVVVEVDAPAAGILVLAEAYAPGWEARVDGHPARVFRANYALRAVVVPAGRVRVAFAYRPAGRVALPLLFLAGLVALGAASLLRWRRLDDAPPELAA
jgi:hypothetical protein